MREIFVQVRYGEVNIVVNEDFSMENGGLECGVDDAKTNVT